MPKAGVTFYSNGYVRKPMRYHHDPDIFIMQPEMVIAECGQHLVRPITLKSHRFGEIIGYLVKDKTTNKWLFSCATDHYFSRSAMDGIWELLFQTESDTAKGHSN